MTLDFFIDMLNVDSTSGSERVFSDFLCSRLSGLGCTVQRIPSPSGLDGPENLLFSWGNPKVVFCTHLDTVPPYFPPTVENLPGGDIMVRGRGACDAKGQIFSMLLACERLVREGASDFGLLLLFGEETGSFGAKAMKDFPGADLVVVGEPTDNKMVVAAKGTKLFAVTVKGKSAHSGYPHLGVSAIERFVDFVGQLRSLVLPEDPVLEKTTYNIGKLTSDNPQNILSEKLTCLVYFRTTFSTDSMVTSLMEGFCSDSVDVVGYGGDDPMHFLTIPGLPTCTVSFGSDAPQLVNFPSKILCGPGSILVAHTPDEHILMSEIRKAADNYVRIYHSNVHNNINIHQ